MNEELKAKIASLIQGTEFPNNPQHYFEILMEFGLSAYSLERADGWVRVEDRLPEIRIRVNAWCGLIVKDMYIDHDGKWKYTNPYGIDDAETKASYVTHWMPLPNKPNDK